jgi:copper homeostasis protein (lipoprotein)
MTIRAARAIAGRFAATLLLAAFTSTAAARGLGRLPASFAGVLPCADCMGVRHQLNVFTDGGFILALSYFRDGRDETFYEMGWYSLNADSTALSLATHDPQGTRFTVQGDGSLRLLDRDGQRIDSGLNYELRREASLLPVEPRLMMRGSYTYMADAGVFTDCRSGMRFPVAPGSGAHELEKAYLEEQAFQRAKARTAQQSGKRDGSPAGRGRTAPGAGGSAAAPEPQPLVVTLQGRIAARPPAGLEGDRSTLIVERFLEAYPNESCGARGVTHTLEGTRWVLTRLGSDPVRLGPKQREIFIVLDARSQRVSGHSGCNRFSGPFTFDRTDGGRLSFGPTVSTRMACTGPDHESRLYHALELTQSHRITGAHLELYGPAGDVLARFEARNL